MGERDWLEERFEGHRRRLQVVAYRILGSWSEAEDAVQETWLRLNRSGTNGIEELERWLTTVGARVCIDMLRSRESHPEAPVGLRLPESLAGAEVADPEEEALLGDSVGMALLVVLETLTPAERVAFVLHDMFDVPFEEIAPIVERSPAAARQLASRARRRVQGATTNDVDLARRRAIVEAFLAAARGGHFEALLALLDPDAKVIADHAAVEMGAPKGVRGASAVAGLFSGRSQGARPALVDGAAGAVWAPGGRPRVVFGFTIVDTKILEIELMADPERLRELNLTVLN